MMPDSTTEHRVEAYLDDVLAPLARRLPDAERAELRRELRAHLWERLEAYRELNLTEDEAVAGALSQFGGAEDFARQWAREWRHHSRRLAFHAAYTAGTQALGLTLAGIAAALAPFCLIEWAYAVYYDTRLGRFLDDDSQILTFGLLAFSFLLLPILVGIRQGRRKIKHSSAALLAALAVEAGIAFPTYSFLDKASPGGTHLISLVGVFLSLCLAWLPVAGIAALVSGRKARKQKGVRA